MSNHAASRALYVRIIGFNVRYERPEERFSCLDLDGAAVMIEQESDFWTTAILARLKQAGIALFLPVEEPWYRAGDACSGNRQFLVQDPDGYLLRMLEDPGEQSAPSGGRIVG